jgi:ATP-binding cassette, subfamily B, multidrug efflux pump
MSHGLPASDARARNTTQVLRRLVPYFAPYRGRLLWIGVLLVVGTLLELAGPYLIGVAVDQFIDPAGQQAPGWLAALLPAAGDRIAGLAIVMATLALTYIVGWVLNVSQFRLMVRVSQQALLHMRSQIMQQMQRLTLSFFEKQESGDLMSRLVNDTQVINDMFGQGLMRILRMSLTLVGIIISMISLNWRLALASYAVLPVILLATYYFSRRVRHAFRQTRKTIGEVSAELQENIAGVREVQAFARENETSSEFREVNARNRAAHVQAETLASLFMPVLDVLSTAATAIVIGFGGYLFLAFVPPLASMGIIVSFMTYVRRFYEPIREMANLFAQMQSALAGAERIFDLLDEKPGIVDAPDAITLPSVRGQVSYEHVSFSYKPGQPVLEDVSFEIAPGQTFAIVGPTGAGKSTLINLLMRFYEPGVGSICIDGHDLRNVTCASLREQIGVVDQDTFLFSGTVMDNLRYGRLDATDEEITAAAKVANAHGFIERMPQGYQSEVGERGAVLSQGNRQLLAITRAILKDPRILVLDEATSSVDTRTERLIQHALEALMTDRTSLVIAHRLSTIRNADQILVIKDSRIVERGTHEELLAHGGAYHELYMSQFRRQEELVAADPADA